MQNSDAQPTQTNLKSDSEQPAQQSTLEEQQQAKIQAPIQSRLQTQEQQTQESTQEQVQDQEKKQQILNLLEAALYVAGRPLNLNEICSVLNTRSKKRVQQYVQMLMQEYSARRTPLEILALKDERYVMQLKVEFTPLVKKLVNRPLLSSGPLRTLSYIAYRQPLSQKRVIEVRGQHAYAHIKLLKEMGLIATERMGRSLVLKTTDYFADYFGLTQDPSSLKRDLKRIFGEALKEDQQNLGDNGEPSS
ncbi:MAG: SMC-Scp complex subunit ScpB [Candidatus Bathyarchaeota archaeon]|nr:SMC-Scp complex subunit ScpB [Candidatus Bathyarchaeota archaeon]